MLTSLAAQWGGKYTLCMPAHTVSIEPGNELHVCIYAEDDVNKATALTATILELLAQHHSEQFSALVDLSHASNSADAATLKAYAPAITHPQITKVAIFGFINETQKVFVEFAVRFAKNSNVEFFDSEAAAKTWLQA